MKSKIPSIVFALALLWATPLLAQPPASPAPEEPAATAEEDSEAAWVKRLDEAAARLAGAQRQVEQLEGAKGKGASRRYPRGDAKAKYLDDLEAAHTELADARAALPELVEEARRAGIPNGVLDRYETAAEDAGVSDADDS